MTADADYVLSGKTLGAYKIEAENIGGEPTSGEITVEDVIPAGTTAEEAKFLVPLFGSMFDAHEFLCASSIKCSFPGELSGFGITSLNPGEKLIMDVW